MHPPTGRITISAPKRSSIETIRVFAISKLAWIRKQQSKLSRQEREAPREYLDRESHYLWGNRYLLNIVERDQTPTVSLEHKRLVLKMRPGSSPQKREAILAGWYREQLKQAIPPLIAKWEPKIVVKVNRFFVQKMKTKWGSCTPGRKTIRLNTELAKKPEPCLEYIVVHEMAHMIAPTHNDRFVRLMDRFLPHWRNLNDVLNSLPVRHERWTY